MCVLFAGKGNQAQGQIQIREGQSQQEEQGLQEYLDGALSKVFLQGVHGESSQSSWSLD